VPEEFFCVFEACLVFEIPGQIDAVGGAVDRVMEAIRKAGCVTGREFEVEIALLEAVANAVKHGCKGNPDQAVELRVLCDAEKGLLVMIRDPGEGFDPESIPSPVEGENLLRTHGRGVWLMNRMMDAVEYRDGGREVVLHKKSTGPVEGGGQS